MLKERIDPGRTNLKKNKHIRPWGPIELRSPFPKGFTVASPLETVRVCQWVKTPFRAIQEPEKLLAKSRTESEKAESSLKAC